MKNTMFAIGNIIDTHKKHELYKVIREQTEVKRALAAEEEAILALFQLKYDAQSAFEKKVIEHQIYMKYYIQAGMNVITCYSTCESKALAFAIRKTNGKYFCRVIKAELISKKEYLRERLMKRYSSPAYIKKGMTVEKFLAKFPELLSKKNVYAFVKDGYKCSFINSIKQCKNRCAAEAVAKNGEKPVFILNELEKYLCKFPYVNARAVLRFIKELRIKSIEELDDITFSPSNTLEEDVRNCKKIRLKACLQNSWIRSLDISEKYPEIFSGRLSIFGKNLGYKHCFYIDTKDDIILRLAEFDNKLINLTNKLIKLNNDDLPKYVLYHLLLGNSEIRAMKYSDNMGITPEEGLKISYDGVFAAMQRFRCGNVKNVPKHILSDLYKSGQSLKGYLNVNHRLFILTTVDYKVFKLVTDYQNDPELWKERKLYIFGGRCICYNYAGLAKYMKPEEVKTSLKKSFEITIKRLLSQVEEKDLYFPKLTIIKQFDGIAQLDSEAKIIEAANALDNCMATCYMSAAKSGETFLFFAKLENEIAGFEIYRGELVQLRGYRNNSVSSRMKNLVDLFISSNHQILDESYDYWELCNTNNKWYDDYFLFEEKE